MHEFYATVQLAITAEDIEAARDAIESGLEKIPNDVRWFIDDEDLFESAETESA